MRYRHWRMCFERLLQAFARWQPGILFDITAQPILEYRWIDSYTVHNCPCEHNSPLQLYIRFTPSRCLDVRQDWYPVYYPEGMKARVSPVQSIEPHRILAPTRDSNQEPPGPESRVVTSTLPLHTTIPLHTTLPLHNIQMKHPVHLHLHLQWKSRIATFEKILRDSERGGRGLTVWGRGSEKVSPC